MYRERIRENYDRLSKSQKRIADFLMTSQREAAFMTASRLAVVLDVDVATITRFAQRLHYPGYPELIDEVRAVVQAEMGTGLHPAESDNPAGRAFLRVLAAERDNVEQTLSTISMDEVVKALEALSAAKTVYVIGQSGVSTFASRLVTRLRLVGLNTAVVEGDTIRLVMSMLNLGAGDVLVGFGFSGYASEVVAALRVGRERGATTIGISGSDISPVARAADITLICSCASPLHVPGVTSVHAVIEALWQALALDRMDIFAANVESFNRTYGEYAKHHRHSAISAEESMMKLY